MSKKTWTDEDRAAFQHWISGRKAATIREWEHSFGRLNVKYGHRSKRNAMGRFGGGWNWNLGFQAGSRTIIINLLVASLRLWWLPLCAGCGKPARHYSLKQSRVYGPYEQWHSECWDERSAS